LRLYFDQFPDTKEKIERFKGFLIGLQESRKFREARISINREDVAEPFHAIALRQGERIAGILFPRFPCQN